MSKPPPDYLKIEVDLWRENATHVVHRLETAEPNLIKRIETFIWRFGYTFADIAHQIRNNPMFASHFAVEPRRQRIHERIAAQWIEELDDVQGFQQLPSKGNKAWYVTGDGELRQGFTRRRPSKSLDFSWLTGSWRIYASHKYTREEGGNQDNQFREVASLLRNFQQGRADDNIILVAIVDGPYYTPVRMHELRQNTRDHLPFSYALPVEEIPPLLTKLNG